MIEVIHDMTVLEKQVKTIKAEMEDHVLDWLKENPEQREDLTIGTVRYYAGTTKTTKLDLEKVDALQMILEKIGDDLSWQSRAELFAQILVAEPFKQGELKARLGEKLHALLFTTTEPATLKTGKPRRTLKRVDTTYLPKETR